MAKQFNGGLGHVIIIIFLLLAIFLEVPLFFTETFYIPGFLTVFSIPFLIFINQKYILKADAIFITKIIIVLLATAFFSTGINHIERKLLGVSQTTVAIAGGILLVKEFCRIDKELIVKVFFWLSLFVLIGTVLEVMGLMRNISDGFRGVAYRQGGYSIYNNEERDILLAGFERPKFFTSEPSLLAIGFFVFSSSWFLLVVSMRNWLFLLLATIIMMYLTSSPILALSVLTSFLIFSFEYIRKENMVKTIIVISIATIVILCTMLFYSDSNIYDRFTKASEGAGTYQISSENLRMVFPYLTAVDVLSSSPFFGVGISGKDVISSLSTLPIDPSDAFGNNNLAALFIYMGFLGAFLFIATFYQYLKRVLTSFQLIILIILVIALTQMMGGFESPRFWGYVFIFIGVLRVKAITYHGLHDGKL